MAKVEIADLIEAICNLTLMEAADIVKELEEKLGVSAAAPVAMAAMPGAGGGGVDRSLDVADGSDESGSAIRRGCEAAGAV